MLPSLDITMNVGKNSGVHNLQVLPFSFSVASLMSITPGDPYQMQHYMEPEDAIAGMGAVTSFSYDANSGIATADWSGARDLGLGAGQTSQVCAMSAPFPPTFGAQSGSFTTDPPCPPDMQTFVLAPSEPEPGSAGLMVVGALSVLLHRKRHD